MSPRSRRDSTCTWMTRTLPIAAATLTAILWSQAGRAGQTGQTLCIEPPVIRLEGRDSRQQLAVSLRSEDGWVRDVTARSRYVLEPRAIATIDAGGIARPRADGHARLRVVFEGCAAEAQVSVERIERGRPIGFRSDVVPLFSKAGCNMGACHGNLNGKGGFRLSLRGEDPAFDFQALTRDQLGRRIDRIARDRQPGRAQADRQIAHEGGLRFRRDSIEAETLIGWIAAGARDDRARALPGSSRSASSPPSGSWRPARATSSSSSPPSSTTGRPATSRGRPPTTSATRRGWRSRAMDWCTPGRPAKRPSPSAT